MIKEAVLQHKAEKERFISECKKYIIREKIPYAEKFLNENIIKELLLVQGGQSYNYWLKCKTFRY